VVTRELRSGKLLLAVGIIFLPFDAHRIVEDRDQDPDGPADFIWVNLGRNLLFRIPSNV